MGGARDRNLYFVLSLCSLEIWRGKITFCIEDGNLRASKEWAAVCLKNVNDLYMIFWISCWIYLRILNFVTSFYSFAN